MKRIVTTKTRQLADMINAVGRPTVGAPLTAGDQVEIISGDRAGARATVRAVYPAMVADGWTVRATDQDGMPLFLDLDQVRKVELPSQG